MNDPATSAAYTTSSPPMRAGLPGEVQGRWVHQRQRARMVEGTWQTDAESWLKLEMRSSERTEHMGTVDISKCLVRDANIQTATLHAQDPVLSADDVPALERFRGAIGQAGLWPLMATAQVMIDTQREGLVRVDVIPDHHGAEGSRRLNYRHVRADLLDVTGYENPDDPSEILGFEEYRRRERGGKVAWYRDVLDVRDPMNPVYKVLDMQGNDASAAFLETPDGVKGSLSGENYPFRLRDGRPVLPGAFFHAGKTSKTWDPFYGVELIVATLKTAVYWTFWGHCVLDASWPQRNGIDLQPAGGVRSSTDKDAPRTARIPTDPANILLWRSTGGKSGTLFQFDPASDPKALGEALRAYQSDALLSWGITDPSAHRTSSNPRSGYAISLSNEAKREAQRKAAPQYRRSTLQLLKVSAAMWNRWGRGEFQGEVPEEGLALEYRGIPLTAEEERLEIERWKALADLGVKSRVDLIMKVEGITRREAENRLAQIQQDNVRFPMV